MAWLKSRRNKNQDSAVAVLEPELAADQGLPPAPTGPSLAVLVPDIAGISSFKFQLSPDAETAEQLIADLRPDVRRGTHSFWALHDQPNVTDDMHVEALVLIRAKEDSDLVYVVSFLDLESALSFTRFEVRRGLSLGNVIVYWAAFAQVREEVGGGVSVVPRTPPKTMPSWLEQSISIAPEYHPEPVSDVRVGEPPAGTGAKTEDAIDRYLRDRSQRELEEAEQLIQDRADTTEAPTVERQPMVEDMTPTANPPVFRERPPLVDRIVVPQREAIPEAPVTEDLAPIIPPTVVEEPTLVVASEVVELPPIDIEEQTVTAQAQVFDEPVAEMQATPESENELFSEIEEERSAIAEAIVLQHPVLPDGEAESESTEHTLLDEGTESGLLVDDSDAIALIGDVQGYSGDEEGADAAEAARRQREETELERLCRGAEVRSLAGDEEREEPRVLASAASEPSNGDVPSVKPYDEFNIAYEVERLLRNRRWTDKKEGGDFDGFKSPPGRF